MPKESELVKICGLQLAKFRDQKSMNNAQIITLLQDIRNKRGARQIRHVNSISNYVRGETSRCNRQNQQDLAVALEVEPVDLQPQDEACIDWLTTKGHNCRECPVRRAGGLVAYRTTRTRDGVQYASRASASAGRDESREPNKGEIKDPKNEITDRKITARLLRGKPPSLLTCVKKAESCLVRESEKVDKHFFGVSTILLVESRAFREPQLLGYRRIVNLGEPGSREREGASILFHTSFDVRVLKGSAPMDSWVELADHNPRAAKQELIRMPGGTLHQLLNSYKLAIPLLEGTCRPFGVITRDLREKEKKVYTQFVFLTTLRLVGPMKPSEFDDYVKRFETKNVSNISRVKQLDPDFFLASPSPKIMDYLAICALLRKRPKHFNDARFARGFLIL
jgi:hypothetical protein